MTSPDIGENNNILLGFAQAESSKGSDQAHVILSLLDYYEMVDQMFSICCDTESSNTGACSGIISVLQELLAFSFFGFSSAIIQVGSTFPTSWKNTLVKYQRPKEGGSCWSAEGTAFNQVDKIKNSV